MFGLDTEYVSLFDEIELIEIDLDHNRLLRSEIPKGDLEVIQLLTFSKSVDLLNLFIDIQINLILSQVLFVDLFHLLLQSFLQTPRCIWVIAGTKIFLGLLLKLFVHLNKLMVENVNQEQVAQINLVFILSLNHIFVF